MIDSFKHKGMRRKLVEESRQKGVNDSEVLAAIEEIPRHFFLDNAFLNYAYEDKAFPIGSGQTISQPFTVAFQTSLLELQKGHKVLEIGTGSGFQTAVLVKMGVKVFTIERQRQLYLKTRELLPKIGFRPRFFYGDGYQGLPAYGPFDRVLVTAGAPFVPEPLKEQLVVGGVLVIPVGAGDVQRMIRIQKVAENEYQEEEFGEFRFVPLLEDKEQGK
ncbi:MAG: protein-L-isoaspartate(D-aspartate) O-methyltransferase [Salibacteraceae bacterium]